MKYLKIANPINTTLPVEFFTTLGVGSTKYDSTEDTQGLFRSGFKLGTLLLVRNGINPIIFNSLLSIKFYTEAKTLHDGLYERDFDIVFCKLSGKDGLGKSINRTEKLSISVDYGDTDWEDVKLSCREYTANALDRSIRETGSFTSATIEIVEENQVRAKNGEMRIFIPLTEEIENFYNQLGKRFLHFSEPYSLRQKILLKNRRSLNNSEAACIYKKGVLVRQIKSEKPSLFDYNFGSELRLDESRNLDDYTLRTVVAKVLADAEPKYLAEVFRKVTSHETVWEADLDSYYLSPSYTDSETVIKQRKLNWGKAWESVAGSNAVMCAKGSILQDIIKKKGSTPRTVYSDSWLKAGAKYDIKEELSIVTEEDKKATEYFEATPEVLTVLDDVWNFVVKLDKANGKDKPACKVFTEIATEESTRLGYYSKDVIYVNKDISIGLSDMLYSTVFEEVCHHVSGSMDFTRSFQDYLFSLLVQARKVIT